jgi:hypothetical protein
MEFVGLSTHRPAIRAAVAAAAERFRAIQIETLTAIMKDDDAQRCSPGALAVLLTGVARGLVLEQALGMSAGHTEALELIQRQLAALEPEPSSPDPR